MKGSMESGCKIGKIFSSKSMWNAPWWDRRSF